MPSVLDFQIETIAIELMLQILERIVKRLKDTIFGKRSKDNWYEIYLTCFVLLNCLSTAYALQLSYMDWNKNMVSDTENIVCHSPIGALTPHSALTGREHMRTSAILRAP